MKRGISVIICCYNSAWIIRRTLQALKEQRLPTGFPYEVLLVDNGCTDETVAIATETMKNGGVDFRIITENTPGLANARRRGVKEVKYEYVIFCDDDNILCPDYVFSMVGIFDEKPEVGAAGGKGVAEFETEPAEIIKEHIECYAVGSQKEHEDWLFGAGLALRTLEVRDVYQNQRCVLMGRKGSELLSGDDSELVLSMVLRGYKICAMDGIWYTHVLKAERLTEEYFNRLYAGLVLPFPVFDVMRAAIYDRKFTCAIRDFLYYYKRAAKYRILFWKPNAYHKRREAYEKMKPFRYWGIFQLYRIFRQWKRIKKRRTALTIGQ